MAVISQIFRPEELAHFDAADMDIIKGEIERHIATDGEIHRILSDRVHATLEAIQKAK